MKKYNKKSLVLSKKSYFAALAICIAMVGLACFCSYRQTARDIADQNGKSPYTADVTEITKETEEAVDVRKNKEGIKKETSKSDVTDKPVTEKTEVHSESNQEADLKPRKFSMPLSGEIIQDFSGNELVKNQTTGTWQTHNGMDISGASGDEVRAMADGTVIDIIDDPLWGVVVVIDHGKGLVARYCGLNKGLNVEKESVVSAKDVIGALGNTADIESAMDTHLHFEVLKNGDYVNPIDIINNKG